MGRPSREPVITNQLKKRVEVWGTINQENELGENEFTSKKLKTIWAAIIPQHGSMGQRAGTDFAAMTHKIIVRYSAGRDIGNTYHFIYAGKRYDVLYQLNPYESNKTIEFFCREIIE